MKAVHDNLQVTLINHRPSFKETLYENVDLQIPVHTHSGKLFSMQVLNPLTARFTKQYVPRHHRLVIWNTLWVLGLEVSEKL